MKKGIAIGEERGISLGITQAKLETAKNMKMEKMSVSMIAHFTGLSIEEIRKRFALCDNAISNLTLSGKIEMCEKDGVSFYQLKKNIEQ